MRSFWVLRKILSMKLSRHKRKTENAGKNAVIQNTVILRKNNPIGVMSANSKGNLSTSHKKIKVGIKRG